MDKPKWRKSPRTTAGGGVVCKAPLTTAPRALQQGLHVFTTCLYYISELLHDNPAKGTTARLTRIAAGDHENVIR